MYTCVVHASFNMYITGTYICTCCTICTCTCDIPVHYLHPYGSINRSPYVTIEIVVLTVVPSVTPSVSNGPCTDVIVEVSRWWAAELCLQLSLQCTVLSDVTPLTVCHTSSHSFFTLDHIRSSIVIQFLRSRNLTWNV